MSFDQGGLDGNIVRVGKYAGRVCMQVSELGMYLRGGLTGHRPITCHGNWRWNCGASECKKYSNYSRA